MWLDLENIIFSEMSDKNTVWDYLYMEFWRRQWHPTPVLLPGKSHGWRSLVGYSPWVTKSWTRLSDFTFTFHFHALEKEMATHSSVLAWRIPGTGEPGGLQSMGSCRVGHDWSDLAAAAYVEFNTETDNRTRLTDVEIKFEITKRREQRRDKLGIWV